MSTRSLIGIVEPDGSVKAIYCHFDGYVEYVGDMLNRHYNSEEKCRQLLELGDLSSLRERIAPKPGERHNFDNPAGDVTVAYHRDRGERLSPPKEFDSKKQMAKEGNDRFCAEFCYVWENGAWHVALTGSQFNGFHPVADVLEEIAAKEVSE